MALRIPNPATRMTPSMTVAMQALKDQGGEGFISAPAADALAFRGLVRLLPSNEAPELLRWRHLEKYRAELTDAGWAILQP